VLLEELAGYYHALDLIGSLDYLSDLCFSKQLLYRVVLTRAVPAINLYGVCSHSHCRICCKEFRHRSDGVEGQASIAQECGFPHYTPGSLDTGGHVRKHELDALEFTN